VDTLHFGRFPVHVSHGASERRTTNRHFHSSQVLRDVVENQPSDERSGSPHSTELDTVDMHVERLAFEVTSDEDDAVSSIDIVLPQAPDPARARSNTPKAM
jgi:hypothetical protein